MVMEWKVGPGRDGEKYWKKIWERRDFVGKMLGTGEDGGECYGKAIGEVNPSTLEKTTSLKYMVVVVLYVGHLPDYLAA